MKEKRCVVLYAGWQMDCCGDPFCVGDTVTWPVVVFEKEHTHEQDQDIHYYYEAHSNNYEHILILTGKVTQIDVLYPAYRPSENNIRFSSVTGFTRSTSSASGEEEPVDNISYSAYIVSLKDAFTHPATPSDITYR